MNYFDATVQAHVGCLDTRGGGAYDAQWRIGYRQVSTSSWSTNSWHNYNCPADQAPHYLSGSPFSEQLTNLHQNRQYEYRLEVQHVSGQAFRWYDKAGTENGADYERFTTDAFPTATPKAMADLRDSIGINTRLPYLTSPYGNCAKTKEALQYLGAASLRDGLWPSYDDSWDCLRDLASTTNVKFTLGLGGLVSGSRLTGCGAPAPGARTPLQSEVTYDHCFHTVTTVTADGPQTKQITVASAAGLTVGQIFSIVTDSAVLAKDRKVTAINGNVVTYDGTDVNASAAYRVVKGDPGDDVRTFDPSKRDVPSDVRTSFNGRLADLDLPANTGIRAAIQEIENANEPDLTPFVNWKQVTLDYQQWLWNTVRQRPGLTQVKISGPSFATDLGYSTFADHSLGPYMDFCNLHPYPGDSMPGASIDYNTPFCDNTAPGKPIVATEYGYHQEIMGVDGGGQYNLGVNPTVQASYSLRAALEHFRRDVHRTDFFTIVELKCGGINDGALKEEDWGWYDCGWNAKPVATAMHNLTTALGDGSPMLTPLPWRLDTFPSDYRQLVLRRSDGAYVVAVWRNVPLWQQGHQQPASVQPAAFKATVPDATSINYVVPTSSPNEVAAPFQNRELQFILGGDPVLFIIR